MAQLKIDDYPLRDFIVPGVNLNGSSKSSLIEGYLDIISALDKVDKAYAEAQPHARDYQTVPGLPIKTAARAIECWRQRRLVLDALKAELRKLAHEVNAQ